MESKWNVLRRMLTNMVRYIDDVGTGDVNSIEKRNSSLADLLMESILMMLPDFTLDRDAETDFYADDGRILCRGEQQTEMVASFIEHIVRGYGFHVMQTGFCDPAEDERSGNTDEYTGFGYIDWE